jgi:membrane protein YqaA with SNARE-associated domain
MEVWIHQLLTWLALPEFGLSTVFVIAFVSATLLPLGSEPAVFGLVKLNPELLVTPWAAC